MSLTPRPRKVLVLDDDALVAETLSLVLSRHGFDTKVAHSGENAVDITAKWQPDVAFIDVMLPGMNGVEFAAILRDQYPQCTIAVMSGHPEAAQLIEQAHGQLGKLLVLAKPLEPQRFVEIAQGESSSALEEETGSVFGPDPAEA